MSGTSRKAIRGLAVVASLLAIMAASAMAQSWTYRYDGGSDTGFWSWAGTERFKYQFAVKQWWDTSNYGGWQTLGDLGFSEVTDKIGGTGSNFLGNGSWHTVATGLSFMYLTGGDSNRWQVNGNYRFSYSYTWGLWYDYYAKTNAWSLMGSGLSCDFLGDGDWHTLRTGISFQYLQGGDSNRWKLNGNYRFSYTYNWGLWYDFSSGTSTWSLLGSGLSSAFLGDGTWHTIGTGLSYLYVQAGDSSRWKINENWRFAYMYGWGQWYDYTVNGWGLLGPSGINQVFIGDGSQHQFTTNDWFQYTGDYYYWLAGSTRYYRYDYVYQKWQDYYGSAWHDLNTSYEKSDVRYIGYHRFVESSLRPDTGTNAPDGYKNIIYDYYTVNDTAYEWLSHVTWAIKNPGTDGIWSGGNLNVVFCNTIDPNSGYATDFHQAWGEYTIQDVIVFTDDMEGIGLQTMVDWLQIAHDYYRKNISNVAFKAHGNSTGWEIGEWIDVYNYDTAAYIAQFQRWGTLMTADGQILSYHCEVGNAADMLDDIALWTGCDIFANTDDVWTYFTWITGSGFDASVWNYNYRNLRWRKDGGTLLDTFEYMSNPSVTYHQLFEERAW